MTNGGDKGHGQTKGTQTQPASGSTPKDAKQDKKA